MAKSTRVEKQTVTQYELGTWSSQDFKYLQLMVKEWHDKQPWRQSVAEGTPTYELSTTEKEMNEIALDILREGATTRG